eukprot:GFUD01020170.1.p1 GENE.GFUD01020170.1~~GFUD01020170.1.p1  ORF type:complete len:203 (-),score=40.28 GFUD01020170.1:246-827(-)
MANSCSESCISFLILISNLLLSLIGLLMIFGAVWLMHDEDATQDIANNMVNNMQFDESVPSDVKESFEEIYNNDTLFYVVIGFGVASVVTALFGFFRFKIGSVRLFCLVLFCLIFTVLLVTLQIAVIAKLHQRNVDIEDMRDYDYKELLNVDMEELEGSGSDQMAFFGVIIAISCGLGCLIFLILVEVIESMS